MEDTHKSNKISKFQNMLLYFCIYAFLGWLMETAYAYHVFGHFVKRGFLYGPLCPIYGFGGVILYSFLGKYKNKSLKLFIYAIIVFSVFEYVASFALDALFQTRWWDYTNDFMNLNGRISIFFSFAWGICALIFLNFIHPFIRKKVKKHIYTLPSILLNILLNLTLIVIVSDFILSCIRYLS